MTTEEFLRSTLYQQLREHAWREDDVLLHTLLQKLYHEPGAWSSAEAFMADALMSQATRQAGLRQQLVDQAARQAPEYVLCTHCNPYAWK